MPQINQFRSSVHGFNRVDVVNYIEYLNNQHAAQIEQLNTQLQNALSRRNSSADLQAQLDNALSRCAQLEKELSERTAAAEARNDDELEAYRRAEQAERNAKERARLIYDQANAVLADTMLKLDSANADLAQQLCQYQALAESAKAVLQDATESLAAIRPQET